ncbi:uncharacterized protein CANTADRAFT_26150 [Suhomyces tanzawaensis NRRL Y-17324]|uniref:Uncharacterized protein n=1 Tax=Suhomyces tanzawaensis NRRL Y-17324 TaxID=984487 RepID=A0A1E4SHV6_9ASCO|nr:uncharacterized protein CANTADRAFT_26150 [Suhomyces tanzawaensis NRRL Y-17324]ODV79099.1 hypothetical protein CANTADRAFT_26150 [Suhomyces tanzawaensis NRRL Y-17324]
MGLVTNSRPTKGMTFDSPQCKTNCNQKVRMKAGKCLNIFYGNLEAVKNVFHC